MALNSANFVFATAEEGFSAAKKQFSDGYIIEITTADKHSQDLHGIFFKSNDELLKTTVWLSRYSKLHQWAKGWVIRMTHNNNAIFDISNTAQDPTTLNPKKWQVSATEKPANVTITKFVLPQQPAPEAITVSGTTDASLHGLYVHTNNWHFGRPEYAKEDGRVLHFDGQNWTIEFEGRIHLRCRGNMATAWHPAVEAFKSIERLAGKNYVGDIYEQETGKVEFKTAPKPKPVVVEPVQVEEKVEEVVPVPVEAPAAAPEAPAVAVAESYSEDVQLEEISEPKEKKKRSFWDFALCW